MLRSLLVFALLCCVTAFAPPASLAVRPAVARAAGPMMKKTGGGGKSGSLFCKTLDDRFLIKQARPG